jgi:asparagine synthase (glutamine-hydrolysing)
MCGIVGIIDKNGVDESLLAAMRDLLAHRGPDDSGSWISSDRRVGIGNRRLAILDLSPAGHMPMTFGDHTITFNGEIYNFLELRSELEALGHHFYSNSDTEVLLKCYRQWGGDACKRLNGMFAFAIWDSVNQRLFAARDRFGEKPFYYFAKGTTFVFGSEAKALLRHPSISSQPNWHAVSDYICARPVDGSTYSFFEELQQLPAAHFMTREKSGHIQLQRYWNIEPGHELRVKDSHDYSEQLRELFFDAVKIRMRSDVPVGTSLSGGLDSSAIACTMRRFWPTSSTQQCTFSARYNEGNTDEGKFIQAVVEATGALNFHVWIRGDNLRDELDQFLYYHDEPVAHTSQFAQWKVYELAKQYNVTVLLDGQGADEALGGYHPPTFGGYFASLLRKGQIIQFSQALSAYRRNYGSYTRGLVYCGGVLLPDRFGTMLRERKHGVAKLLRQRVINGYDPQESIPTFASPLKSVFYKMLTRTSIPALLRYGDRSSAAHSREPRLPFLDHRIIEFLFSVPDKELVGNGLTKTLLRQAMDGIIPDLVRDRKDKIGFSTPEALWFQGDLRLWIEDMIARSKRRGVLDAEMLDRLWNDFVRGKPVTGNLWRVANLEAWLQRVS